MRNFASIAINMLRIKKLSEATTYGTTVNVSRLAELILDIEDVKDLIRGHKLWRLILKILAT